MIIAIIHPMVATELIDLPGDRIMILSELISFHALVLIAADFFYAEYKRIIPQRVMLFICMIHSEYDCTGVLYSLWLTNAKCFSISCDAIDLAVSEYPGLGNSRINSLAPGRF